jgi:hypothetical protein
MGEECLEEESFLALNHQQEKKSHRRRGRNDLRKSPAAREEHRRSDPEKPSSVKSTKDRAKPPVTNWEKKRRVEWMAPSKAREEIESSRQLFPTGPQATGPVAETVHR